MDDEGWSSVVCVFLCNSRLVGELPAIKVDWLPIALMSGDCDFLLLLVKPFI